MTGSEHHHDTSDSLKEGKINVAELLSVFIKFQQNTPVRKYMYIYIYIYIYTHLIITHYTFLFMFRFLVDPSSKKWSSKNYTVYLIIHFHEECANVNNAFHAVLRLLLVSQEGLCSLDFVSCVQY